MCNVQWLIVECVGVCVSVGRRCSVLYLYWLKVVVVSS